MKPRRWLPHTAPNWPGSGPRSERVALGQAAGRVLAQPLRADRDQPPFSRSTRDGFACRAAEASRHRFLRLAGSTRAGDAPAGPLPQGRCLGDHDRRPGSSGRRRRDDDRARRAGRRDRSRLLPPRTIEAGENIVAQGAQARSGRRTAPRRNRNRVRADRPGRGLRLRHARGLCPAPRGHPYHRRRDLCPSSPRPLPARFATRTPPCWRRWWRRRAASPGFCPLPPTMPKPSTPRSPRPRRPTCCSSPAASRRANSIWSSRPWPAPAPASTLPACASSPASRWSSAKLPVGNGGCNPDTRCGVRLAVLRASRQSRLFGGHVFALCGAGAGGACGPSRMRPALCPGAAGRRDR